METEAVAHLFPIPSDEEFDPKLKLQYSIWGQHGSHPNVKNYFVRTQSGDPTTCLQFKAQCRSIYIEYFRSLKTLQVKVSRNAALILLRII